MRRLPAEELALSLRCKLVPLVNLPGLTLFVACGEPALAIARHDGLKVVGYAESQTFIAAARHLFGAPMIAEAAGGLARRRPWLSAKRRLTPWQMGMALCLLAVVVIMWVVLPVALAWMIASTIGGLFFLSVIALRVLSLLPRPRREAPLPAALAEHDLPIYSVLVPLFRETSVLGQLLDALTKLDYPQDKLDIKLILEESDIIMQRALAAIRLPPQFDVITVPSGKPQTKPRALNYALPFCRGDLLTIYDAEDIPDAGQLRAAAAAFAVAPRELACLQAELNFYNPDENWLARQFTIEYATLFGMVLPALAHHRLPLLLGGTSNHFRIKVLREVGGWDPHNVTEDADLGLRLARLGYDTATLDSHTGEEANVRLLNWMKQRGRWLKGFLATWLVHMREPRQLWRDLGPAGFWLVQAATLGVFASALLHPVCLAGTVALAVLTPPLGPDASLLQIGLAGLNLLILVAGYGTTMAAGAIALRRRGLRNWIVPLMTMPIYWLLMSAAAWYALWQFMTAPFHWNKTEHGLSRTSRRIFRKRTKVLKQSRAAADRPAETH